ncbi:hypothetical protein BDW60DRAFT_211389 [Aspergillus nidulans var. acristatus]
MAKWAEEEVAVLAYFASLGVQRHVITQLLRERGYHRTDSSVTHKIEDLIKSWSLRENGSWNLSRVDDLLNTLDVDFISLLQPTAKDQEIINQFQSDINLWACHLARRTRDAEYLMSHGLGEDYRP